MEIWKEIEGYDGAYLISNYGRVMSKKHERGKGDIIMRTCNDKQGYQLVKLCMPNNIKMAKVHRLVGQAFIPNPNNYPVINHKDGNKKNNYYSNLEWCTQQENSRHAVLMGLHKYNKKIA